MTEDLVARAAQAFAAPAASAAADKQISAALSTDEVVALTQVGYEPVAVISASAVARLGNFAQWSLHPTRNYEVPTLTRLLNNSRTKTILDLRHRCEEIEAHGVVGARINLEGVEQEGVATFVATGTAIRRTHDASPDARQPHTRVGLWARLRHRSGDMAFTCTLSGQDFHLLLRSGGYPMGFVVGTSAFHFGWRSAAKWASSQGRCVELATLTESLYGAREKAIERLGLAARELDAKGVIDTKVIERPAIWGRHVIEFAAYGTAIAWDSASPTTHDVGAKVMLNDRDNVGTSDRLDTFNRVGSDQNSLR
ncbi:MAG: heavy metal-binding domain-containing protein [Candidatus Dormibacterales bacterium]